MRTSSCVFGLIAFLTLHSALAAPETQPAVRVLAGFVGEIRARSLDTKQDSPAAVSPYVEVYLKLQGESVQSAVTFANLRIDQALDDRGRSMLPPSRQVRFLAMQRTLRPLPPSAQLVLVPLSGTERDATSIARLKGQLQLRVGQDPTVVVIPHLKSRVNNQPIADAALAGLAVQVSVSSAGADDSLWVTAAGTPEFVGNVDLLDEHQNSIAEVHPFARMYFPNQQRSVKLPRGVDDAMSLRITVYARTTIVVVPFDLKDIALP